MLFEMLVARSILGITAVSAGLMLFVVGSLLHSGLPGVRHWFWANLTAAVAMLLLVARGHIPDLLSIPIANGMLAVSIFQLVGGTRLFFGLSSAWRISTALTAGFIVLLAWLTWGQPNFNLRVASFSALHAGACTWLAVIILRARSASAAGYSHRFAAAIALLEATIHLVRGGLYLSSPIVHFEFEATILNISSFALGTLAMPALTIGLMLLAHDRRTSALELQVDIDELTGAASRRAFLRHAQTTLSLTQQDGAVLSIVMIDIDWFKRLNDTFGHAGGDAVLHHFVQTALAHLRTPSLIGRLGGEEFGVLMPGTDAAGACQWLDRLREHLGRTPLLVDSHVASYTFSAGVVECSNLPSVHEALKMADELLYQAKEGGRNMTIVDSAYTARRIAIGAT